MAKSSSKPPRIPVLVIVIITAAFTLAACLVIQNYSPLKRSLSGVFPETPRDAAHSIPSSGVKTMEKAIDNDQAYWLQYRNQTFSFSYPMYLGAFNEQSTTDSKQSDTQIAHYFRNSDSPGGDNYSGRSYGIIIMQKDPYYKTQGMDVEKWISNNKLNLKNPDCKECLNNQLPIEKVTLDGRSAFLVSRKTNDGGEVLGQDVYFQTKYGIASVGFYTMSPSSDQDYQVFQRVLSTVKIL